MKNIRHHLSIWLKGMSRVTKVGGVVLVIGAAIDLVYHGVLLTVFPLPAPSEQVVQYAGHVITFIGMLIMLLGVVMEGLRHSRGAPARTSRSNESIHSFMFIRRR